MRIRISEWFGGFPPGSTFDVKTVMADGFSEVYVVRPGPSDFEYCIPCGIVEVIDKRTKLSAVERNELFDFLRHGDDEHQGWLKEAIEAFFHHRPRPPVRGTGA